MSRSFPFVVGLLVVLGWAAAGCVGEEHHDESWDARRITVQRESPYMPTVHNEERIRRAKHRNWQEVHVPKMGLVGYLSTRKDDLYAVKKPRDIHHVFNVDHDRIGFITQNGSTHRYVFDDYKQTEEYIGHYHIKEGIAHLLKVPVKVELKPLSIEAPEY